MQQFVSRIVTSFGIAPQRRDTVCDAVATFEVAHTVADTLHYADAFEANNHWAREGLSTDAKFHHGDRYRQNLRQLQYVLNVLHQELDLARASLAIAWRLVAPIYV